MKEPTRSVASKSLNRIKRTERRVIPTLTPQPFSVQPDLKIGCLEARPAFAAACRLLRLRIRTVRNGKRAPVQDHAEYSASGGFDFFLNLARGLPRGETRLNNQNNAVGQ